LWAVVASVSILALCVEVVVVRDMFENVDTFFRTCVTCTTCATCFIFKQVLV